MAAANSFREVIISHELIIYSAVVNRGMQLLMAMMTDCH